MALDLGTIAKQMFDAAYPVLKDKAPEIASYAEGEFKKIAQTIITIDAEFATGQISSEQAALLLDMQKSATRSVLLTAEGLSLLVVEQAINAALSVVKTAVNTALGFALI